MVAEHDHVRVGLVRGIAHRVAEEQREGGAEAKPHKEAAVRCGDAGPRGEPRAALRFLCEPGLEGLRTRECA